MRMMTQLEYELLEGIGEAVTKFRAGDTISNSEAMRQRPGTDEERWVQIVDFNGQWRLDVTMLADRLRKAIEADRFIEVAVHRPGAGVIDKKKLGGN